MLGNLFVEEFLPNIWPKPALAQFDATSLVLSLVTQEKMHLATSFFQVVVESDKILPEPPFLQPE